MKSDHISSRPYLELVNRTKDEVAHYFDSETGDLIVSSGNAFRVKINNCEHRFTVPLACKYALTAKFRLTRRALRLDKSNAVFNYARDGIVVLYRGKILFYDLLRARLTEVGQLRQCRNVLHCGIAVTKAGIFFGEYGANQNREAVPVWRSKDDGRNWEIVYEFLSGSIKHIHGVYADPHSDSLWIPTGDFYGECYLFEVQDPDFCKVLQHGDGKQRWRPVSLFFEPDKIIWVMDSQIETSFLQVFDRANGLLQELRGFEGPVWYSKRFTDGSAVLQTTVEVGNGVKSNYSHIYFSEDLINWIEVARYRKDIWPMRYFKFGVVAFADGPQNRNNFLMFGEALRGMDGRVHHARIQTMQGLPNQKGQLRPLSESQRQWVLSEIAAGSFVGLAWREKLRRFASLHRWHLRVKSRSSFGVEWAGHLIWITEALICGKLDAASINGALFAVDSIKNKTLSSRVREELNKLGRRLKDMPIAEIQSPPLGDFFNPSPQTWQREATMAKPVVIICPMQKSIYTLAVMELCRKYGVPIAGVILRKLDIVRFRHEFNRDGIRLLHKVWRNLVLRTNENKEASSISLKSVFNLLNCGFSDVRTFARHIGAPVFEVSKLLEPPSGLSPQAASVALFTGGGLIGEPMLKHFKDGIVNVHLGVLPQYKGMDVVQAPILDGCFDKVGMSAHLMSPGLDEGPVVSYFTTNSDSYSSLGALRNEMSALLPLMSFDACLGLASGRYNPIKQNEAGRQYFLIHKSLHQIIAEVMEHRYIKKVTPSKIKALVERILPGDTRSSS